MRFYYDSKIDKSGRINIRGKFKAQTLVVFYVNDNEDYVHLAIYNSSVAQVPKNAIYTVDSKGRVCMPKCFRKNAKRVLISTDSPSELILKLVDED